MNRKIKSLMALRGFTNRKLAHEIGVSETWLSLVIHGHRKSERVRHELAKRLGVKASELWPNNGRKAA